MGAERCKVARYTSAVRRRWVLAAVLLLALPARAERLPVRTYGAPEGLSGDLIRFVVQDSRGFLWLATNAGVSRFDGASFTNFGAESGIPYASARKVVETADGTVYVLARERVARWRSPGKVFEAVSSPSWPAGWGTSWTSPRGPMPVSSWWGSAGRPGWRPTGRRSARSILDRPRIPSLRGRKRSGQRRSMPRARSGSRAPTGSPASGRTARRAPSPCPRTTRSRTAGDGFPPWSRTARVACGC